MTNEKKLLPIFYRLFNLLTVGTIFLLLLNKYESKPLIKKAVRQDGLLDQNLPFTHYATVEEFFADLPQIKEGAAVNKEACLIKVPASTRKFHMETAYGYNMSLWEPTPPLATIIETMSVSIIGYMDFGVVQKHIAMLKEVLPSLGDQRFLAGVLGDPYLKFVIEYQPKEIETERGTRTRAMTISENIIEPENMASILFLNGNHAFHDHYELLHTLLNEYHHLSVIRANDCRHGKYSNSIFRDSPFTFTRDSRIVKKTAMHKNKDVKKVMRELQNNYDDCINSLQDYMLMCRGKKRKTPEFYQLASMLDEALPYPETELIRKKYTNVLLPPVKAPLGKNYTYPIKYTVFGETRERYAVRNSYRALDKGDVEIDTFAYDPRTTLGKLHAFYVEIVSGYARTILGKDNASGYSSALKDHDRVDEFFSILKQLPSSLSKSFFPLYHNYMISYTRLDEGEHTYFAP